MKFSTPESPIGAPNTFVVGAASSKTTVMNVLSDSGAKLLYTKLNVIVPIGVARVGRVSDFDVEGTNIDGFDGDMTPKQ